MWYVYILYNSKIDRYYIGRTMNIDRRVHEHNTMNSKVRYTSKYEGEWDLVYCETYEQIGEATKRERYIKKQKSRKYITNLIKSARSSAG